MFYLQFIVHFLKSAGDVAPNSHADFVVTSELQLECHLILKNLLNTQEGLRLVAKASA